MKTLTLVFLFLSACNSNEMMAAGTSSASGTAVTSSEIGPKGDKGDTGPMGPTGAQGLPGARAPLFTLQDSNGVTLTGQIVSDMTLYSATEDSTVTYDSNGIVIAPKVYFKSTNCTGAQYIAPTYMNQIVQINGSAFIAKDKYTGDSGAFDSYKNSNGACVYSAATGQLLAAKFYTLSNYTGAFPILTTGPYKVISQ